jgi:hypothetical protein
MGLFLFDGYKTVFIADLMDYASQAVAAQQF